MAGNTSMAAVRSCWFASARLVTLQHAGRRAHKGQIGQAPTAPGMAPSQTRF